MDRLNRKYVPDLTEYMAQCEVNYALMIRLLNLSQEPKENHADSSQVNAALIEDDSAATLPFHIEIYEETRYTTTLNLSVELLKSEWVSPVKMRVRLYHDAQMAEVLEPNRNHAPRSSHAYPKQVQHYPDDKYQRNELLNQFLRRCFHHETEQVVMPVITYAEN
ncbi:DUF1249 domain-containing protein [Pleionea sediminis]|uniref:DUF1249 domain-containing protein n=1 Tax=Pleionea sediminis TaxID=2569479 RepID=UPI00197CAB96|nr:DUF1249 domain-containing protein [Pleionea sediminis]